MRRRVINRILTANADKEIVTFYTSGGRRLRFLVKDVQVVGGLVISGTTYIATPAVIAIHFGGMDA